MVESENVDVGCQWRTTQDVINNTYHIGINHLHIGQRPVSVFAAPPSDMLAMIPSPSRLSCSTAESMEGQGSSKERSTVVEGMGIVKGVGWSVLHSVSVLYHREPVRVAAMAFKDSP